MVSKIKNSTLSSKLQQQAAAAAQKADKDQDGTLFATEQQALSAELKDNAAALTSGKPVRTKALVDGFVADANAQIARADQNQDGFLSAAEQKKLPLNLQDNLAQLTVEVTPGPAPTSGGKSAFGISGTLGPSQITLKTVLATGLDYPTGLAVNPRDQSMWIVNHGNDSSVIVDGLGTAAQKAKVFHDTSAHFMNKPMQLAFSRTQNEFASIQESNNNYTKCKDPEMQMGNMFMGPTLFTADRSRYNGSDQTHLDMLHHSPFGVGIAAGSPSSSAATDRREYFVFNGQSGSVDRYFFNKPHELGGTNHADGQTVRYAAGELKRVPKVPGNLAFDPASGALYIADTGNHRIAKLDTTGSLNNAVVTKGFHDETPLYTQPGAHLTSVTGAAADLQQPSGLILKDGLLICSDFATGHIKVFGTDGSLRGDVDTGLGAKSLTGLAEGPDGKLYFLDAKRNTLVQLNLK